MHRVARSFSTTAAAARCPKMTSSAARLAAHSLRSVVAHPAAAAVRPLARIAGAGGAHPRRMIHVRVPLPYKVEDGMGDFLSPEALRVIAVDYQQGLLDRLNEQIKGTPRHD
jgi:superoxide dismutase, Fe-Mn family